jgi:hypothetical protein
MMLTQEQVMHALQLLGVDPKELAAVRCADSWEEGAPVLAALQQKVRREFKHLARELHPDATGGDTEKEEAFKVVKTVVDGILDLELRLRPEPASTATTYTTTSPFVTVYPGVTISVGRPR